MEILLSTDNNYVMPTGVLMTSVSMNNVGVNYHILVGEDFKEENIIPANVLDLLRYSSVRWTFLLFCLDYFNNY